MPIYVNAGPHAGMKDRVLNGGAIVNYKVPETGDASSLTLWLALLGGSAAALTGLVLLRKRRASKP